MMVDMSPSILAPVSVLVAFRDLLVAGLVFGCLRHSMRSYASPVPTLARVQRTGELMTTKVVHNGRFIPLRGVYCPISWGHWGQDTINMIALRGHPPPVHPVFCQLVCCLRRHNLSNFFIKFSSSIQTIKVRHIMTP